MATVDVCTPTKGRVFTTKTAGGRMPLTPSPKTNRLFTSTTVVDKSPLRVTPTFIHAIPLPNAGKSGATARGKASAARSGVKSNIALHGGSPKQCVSASSSALGGVDSPSKLTTKSVVRGKARPPLAKSTVRVAYNAADRFMPNRAASDGLCNLGEHRTAKLELEMRPKSSGKGSAILASAAAAGAFGIGGRGAEEDVSDDTENVSGKYGRRNPEAAAYESSIAEACGVSLNTRILAFKPAAPESSRPIDLRAQYSRPIKQQTAIAAQLRRRILTSPERVLDAPELVDDYYLNVLDWSCNNQVAIGLAKSVYVWSADSGGVCSLMETENDAYISSLKWSSDGAYVSVGLSTGEVQIWDVEEQTKVRSMFGHESRVSVMSWNKHVLSTGARNGWLFNHDVRIANHKIANLECHTGEVCGLEWRPDGSQLAAGGNDNLVSIWDARALNAPKFQKTNHTAAVKALSWCPWTHNLLATGGGSYDRHIHFWNTTTGARVNSIDTGSQVTSLQWSTHHKEIASTGGFPDNSISVWQYPSLLKSAEIPAHESRVLHSCLSPDGQTMATAAADESLKFWKIFEKKPGSGSAGLSGLASGTGKEGVVRTIR